MVRSEAMERSKFAIDILEVPNIPIRIRKPGLRFLGLLLLLLSALSLLDIHTALACSCAPPGSPGEALDGAAAVFAGQVVALDFGGPVDGVFSTGDPVEVTFRVSALWKGPSQRSMVVHTVRSTVSCGYEFQLGREYLVYATGSDKHLATGLCTRTRPLEQAGVDLAELGDSLPLPPEPPPSLLGFLPPLGIIAISLTLILVALKWRERGSNEAN
jgi:hypothetical protein